MTSPLPFDWDIFCCVVDNFGDIGVTWRLARQLKQEGALPAQKSEVQVRLWVDDLVSFARICPALDPHRTVSGSMASMSSTGTSASPPT